MPLDAASPRRCKSKICKDGPRMDATEKSMPLLPSASSLRKASWRLVWASTHLSARPPVVCFCALSPCHAGPPCPCRSQRMASRKRAGDACKIHGTQAMDFWSPPPYHTVPTPGLGRVWRFNLGFGVVGLGGFRSSLPEALRTGAGARWQDLQVSHADALQRGESVLEVGRA